MQERILAIWMGGEPGPGLVVVCPYGPYEKGPEIEMKQINSSSCTGVRLSEVSERQSLP